MAKNKGGRLKNTTIEKVSPPRLSNYERQALHELRAFGVSDYRIRQLRKFRYMFQPYEVEFQRQSEKYNVGYKSASYSSYLAYLKQNAEPHMRIDIGSASRKYFGEIITDIGTYEETGYISEAYSGASQLSDTLNALFERYGFDYKVTPDKILSLNKQQIEEVRKSAESVLNYKDDLKKRSGMNTIRTVQTLGAIIGMLS